MVIAVGRYVIPDSDLTWRFSRSSGPGGQHVNTTDTRVELLFDLGGSEAFPDDLKQRLLARFGAEVRVAAAEHRSQHRNRRLAEERLALRLEEAMEPREPRRVPTKPSRAARRRRVSDKKKRGETKQLRRRPDL